MKAIFSPVLALVLVFSYSTAHANDLFTIDEYNNSLAKFGVPFHSRYPASFYTGFAMRVEDPRRIHFRAGRGNQVRLTAILDEYTLLTYLYTLKKRQKVYGEAKAKGMLKAKSTDQMDAFSRIVDSPTYNIGGTIQAFEEKKLSREQLYQASLDILAKLNPHRVFPIDMDLKAAFLKWQPDLARFAEGYKGKPDDQANIEQFITKNADDAIVVSNDMLFGRVNVFYLTDQSKKKLAEMIALVGQKPADDSAFLGLARDYFKGITGGKYDFRTVADGKFVPALQCEKPADQCRLAYSEFTAIYPNGSAKTSTQDRHGNTIHIIRNSVLMPFLDRSHHDVDHIRSEGYYGYAPKMDWQSIGNGIHNPGVSHHLPGMRHLYQELDIPKDYKFVWVVSRGPVSHGCVRMSVGHLWEVRESFPAGNERMKKAFYFGNHSADYDVYDIDGDGELEVMGTKYVIAYSVKGPSGDSSRKGKGFSTAKVTKEAFYKDLYGKGQYVREGDTYKFTDPYVSYFRKKKASSRNGKVISRPLKGAFSLYEQLYEKDKVQVYHLPPKYRKQLKIRDNKKSTGKQMVRVLGRISACGPFKGEWSLCNEEQFDQEFQSLLGKL